MLQVSRAKQHILNAFTCRSTVHNRSICVCTAWVKFTIIRAAAAEKNIEYKYIQIRPRRSFPLPTAIFVAYRLLAMNSHSLDEMFFFGFAPCVVSSCFHHLKFQRYIDIHFLLLNVKCVLERQHREMKRWREGGKKCWNFSTTEPYDEWFSELESCLLWLPLFAQRRDESEQASALSYEYVKLGTSPLFTVTDCSSVVLCVCPLELHSPLISIHKNAIHASSLSPLAAGTRQSQCCNFLNRKKWYLLFHELKLLSSHTFACSTCVVWWTFFSLSENRVKIAWCTWNADKLETQPCERECVFWSNDFYRELKKNYAKMSPSRILSIASTSWRWLKLFDQHSSRAISKQVEAFVWRHAKKLLPVRFFFLFAFFFFIHFFAM